MTDLAVPGTQAADLQVYRQSSVDRLQRWAEQAVTVRRMAEGIVHTSFCPKAYRGKPDEATAAILAGAELGFDPMASLRAFDDIQGTPAPKAITLRAVVQAKGHEIVVVEEGPTRAIVKGRRRGDTEWQTSEWTIERATAAGYVAKNPNYKTKPAEMLIARATAQVSRWIGSDAIMGMPYSAEEIADAGLEARPSTRRVTAADIVGKAVELGGASTQQVQDIGELFEDRGIEPDARLEGVARLIGRRVSDVDELTSGEAEQVIAALTRSQEHP